MTYDQAEHLREAIDGVLAGAVVVLLLAGIFIDEEFFALSAVPAIILVVFEGLINLLAYLTDV